MRKSYFTFLIKKPSNTSAEIRILKLYLNKIILIALFTYTIFTFLSCNNHYRDNSAAEEEGYNDDIEIYETNNSNKSYEIYNSGKITDTNNISFNQHPGNLQYNNQKSHQNSTYPTKVMNQNIVKSSTKLIDPNNKIKAKFSKEYPNYRIMFPGFNTEGKCKTIGCKANGKYTWSPHGYYNEKYGAKTNVFNLGEEMKKSKCPLCSEDLIDVRGYGFYKCICEYDANEIFRNKIIQEICVFNDSESFIYHKINQDLIKNHYYINLKVNPTIE